MAPNDQAQKSLQIAEIARQTAGQEIPAGATFRAFHRFIAEVAGTQCEHSARNGHMITETAHKCGIVLAEAELDILDNLDVEVDFDAKLAAVAITVIPVERYLGVKASVRTAVARSATRPKRRPRRAHVAPGRPLAGVPAPR